MSVSSRTPEGFSGDCPVCGKPVVIDPAFFAGDAPCPHCGNLLWFTKHFFGADSAGVVLDLNAGTHREAVREILEFLASKGMLEGANSAEIGALILEGNFCETYGIGGGVAVPHAAHESIKKPIYVMARTNHEFGFPGINNEPVRTIFLILGPKNQPRVFLEGLERLSRYLRTLRS